MKTSILGFCTFIAVTFFGLLEKSVAQFAAATPPQGDPTTERVTVTGGRPLTRWSFVTVAPLFGATEDSPDVEVFALAGIKIDFGGRPEAAEQEAATPASMFGR